MAKQPSLAASSGALTTGGLTLPAVFQAAPPVVKARNLAPYVAFCHPKRADEWTRAVSKFGSMNEGDMVLFENDTVTKLNPAKLTLLCCKQWWGEANAVGDLLKTSWEERPRPYKEHIDAVVLVYLEDRIVPANIEFRSTKCPAGKTLADALAAAAEASWADRSAAHKETLICNQPWMRYFGEVTLAPTRTSKASGLTYRPTQCSVKPTGIPEWRLLKAFTEAENTQKLLDAAAERFMQRVNDVTARA
jgi:hypothetical protein